ncbi:fatty acid desaturase [Amnimonas aquatica]|uniref:Alkane 1-monooxygenase n=3 Tax=Pseudomonadota TaxID=1224 RepID=A0A2P6ATA5_9GAMM|nr:fatty acid desaturase [Amnimonas aquatica]PQA46973.1 alkane 1-monooxygenase [Amnimonas aquatica]
MTTTTLQTATPWVDGKRYLWLLSPLLPLLGLFILAVYQYTGWGIAAWGGPLLVYAIIPLLDWLIGTDQNNPPESAVAQLEDDKYYRFIVYAYIPSQFILTVWGAWLVATHDMPAWHWIGLVLSVGAVNGIAINTGHELSHKRDAVGRWMAKLTLAPVAYGHFFTEHVRGHHKNVATPEDPASSKMGESFWAFLPRTMIGSVVSAWHIEKERLARQGKGVWTLQNDNLQAWALTVVFFGGLTAWLGWAALPWLLLQAFYGASLLEVINYIEHYGLLRQKGKDGRYVRCSPEHSWNSNQIVTNLFLYQLQRHSDHHAHPTRSFQALRHFEESPQLPSGYASMLIPAYIPPLWFRQMDPLVAAHYKGDLSLANILPSKREKILASALNRAQTFNHAVDGPIPAGAPAHAQTDGTARYQCSDCGYIYDERKGCPQEGFPPGTRWTLIPDSWPCPDCAVREKVDFVALKD